MSRRRPPVVPQESPLSEPEPIDPLDVLPEEEPVDEEPTDPLLPNEEPTNTVFPDHQRQLSVEAQSTANLAEAILLMTAELKRRQEPTRKAKAKEPDTFDGSDPRKLNNFILLCNLYFRNNPAYSEDEAKVTLALSYLRGTALDYFEPSLLDSDDAPEWMEDWPVFVRTLRTQFGPIDPTADAEDGIDHLKMQDNQHIVKYNVEFNRLAIRTGWDDSVLRHRYYSGLAERIKDIMGQQGKPATLEAMKTLAHSIDSRHWERLREKSRAGKGKSDKPDKPDAKSDDKSDDKGKKPASGNNSNSNNNNNKNNKSNAGKPGKPASSSGNTASISDKLGKDGKLTPQERQRRFDNNLCLFCGGVGHSAKDCPKSSSSASKTKARAAQAKEKESPDSKKA
jgi:Retrotransposon gag protein